jgi:hypothetical protein
MMRMNPKASMMATLCLLASPLGVGPAHAERPAVSFLRLERSPVLTASQGCRETVRLGNNHPHELITAHLSKTQYLFSGMRTERFTVTLWPGDQYALGCSWWSGAMRKIDYEILDAWFVELSEPDPWDAEPVCMDPNPAGCRNIGCGLGQDCVTVGCFPSTCACDPETGSWLCTTDCAGGVCLPLDPIDCPLDQAQTIHGCQSCEEALAAAEDAARVFQREVILPCAEDDDCGLFEPATGCSQMCPVAIHLDATEEFAALEGLLSQAFCVDFETQCPDTTPHCAPGRAACVDGSCRFVER